MEKNTHPVVRIEKTFFKSIKNENIIKFLQKYKIQVFHEQNVNEVFPSFQTLLNSINHSTIKLPVKPWEVKYSYKGSSGSTKILLHTPFDINKPTLVFHHGLASTTQLHLRVFTNSVLKEKFNIFSIKAANHNSSLEVRNKCINTFQNLALTVASSVLAIDEVVDFHKNNSNQKIVVAGVSMGGMIASLHYFFFNTADLYFPVISYPNFGEIILNENNKKFVANYDKLIKNKSLIKSFDIPKNLKKKPKDKIFPVIAEHDELIDYDTAKKFWSKYDLTTYNVGHHTIFIKVGEIRKLILSKTFN